MLKNFICLESHSKLTIVEDNIDAPSDDVLLAFINNTNSRNAHFICCDDPPSLYAKKISIPLTYHDLFTDPLHWLTEESNQPSFLSIFKDKLISEDCDVFIDSVSTFLCNQDFPNFARELSNVLKRCRRIVLRIHRDTLINFDAIAKLGYLSSLYVAVMERLKPAADCAQRFLVQVTQRHPDGRFKKKQAETLEVADYFSVTCSVFSTKVEKAPVKTVNMDALTTFNLGTDLSLSEKVAKDQLVLPYMRTSDEPIGIIEYEADEADLEEDPDDDLEL